MAVLINTPIFRYITPHSTFKVNGHFRGTCRLIFRDEEQAKQETSTNQALLATCIMLVFCLAYSLTLNVKAKCSSETSIDFVWTWTALNPRR
jgi:hypothetical protein